MGLSGKSDDKTSRKINRITIDIDDKDINSLLKCLKTLKKYHFDNELIVKPSATNKGYHVIAWSKKGYSKDKLLKIRLKAGDDRIRCMLDNKSNRMIQVLFTSKKKGKSKIKIDNIPMEYVVEGEEENVKISVGEI